MKPLSGAARGCEIIRWFSPKLKSLTSRFSYTGPRNAQPRGHSRAGLASRAGSSRPVRSRLLPTPHAALNTPATKAAFCFKPAGRFPRGQGQSRGVRSSPPRRSGTDPRAHAHRHSAALPRGRGGTVLGNRSLHGCTGATGQCTGAALGTRSQQAGRSRRGVLGTGPAESTCPLVGDWGGGQRNLSAAGRSGLILLGKGSGQHRQPLAPE